MLIQKLQHAALLFAMQDEALPLIRRLGLADKGFLSPPMPMRWYDGKVGGLRVSLYNGVEERWVDALADYVDAFAKGRA